MPPEFDKSSSETKGKNIAVLLVVLLFVVGIVYFFLNKSILSPAPLPPQVEEKSEEAFEIKHKYVMGESASSSKVPPGFPTEIPIEEENIIESYSVEHKNRSLTQYTVSFNTSRTPGQVYSDYEKYMTEAGYSFGRNGKDPQNYNLYGTLSNDDLSIYINFKGEKRHIVVGFIDRQ